MDHDLLSVEQILDGLGNECLGRRVLWYRRVDSTNALARALAVAGEPEGTVISAEEQTAGRGRSGRTWLASVGTSLLFSVILRPSLEAKRVQNLTVIAALALRDALFSSTALRAEIKWPNDLLLSGRKVAGILTEMRSVGDRVDFAILGIGLNVNQQVGAFAPALNATSLAIELGYPVDRAPLLQTILRCLELRYRLLGSGQSPITEWAEALVTLGQRMQIECGDRTYEGCAEAVDETGALLVRLDDGQLLRAPAGDVHTLVP